MSYQRIYHRTKYLGVFDGMWRVSLTYGIPYEELTAQPVKKYGAPLTASGTDFRIKYIMEGAK